MRYSLGKAAVIVILRLVDVLGAERYPEVSSSDILTQMYGTASWHVSYFGKILRQRHMACNNK